MNTALIVMCWTNNNSRGQRKHQQHDLRQSRTKSRNSSRIEVIGLNSSMLDSIWFSNFEKKVSRVLITNLFLPSTSRQAALSTTRSIHISRLAQSCCSSVRSTAEACSQSFITIQLSAECTLCTQTASARPFIIISQQQDHRFSISTSLFSLSL